MVIHAPTPDPTSTVAGIEPVAENALPRNVTDGPGTPNLSHPDTSDASLN
jgi:hypothetical protein